MKVKSLSRVQPLATPWTAAYQVPPSMGRVLEWGAIAFSVHQGSKVEIMSLEKYLKKLVFYPKGEQTQRRGHTVIVSKFHAT